MTERLDSQSPDDKVEHSLMDLERELLRWKFDPQFSGEKAEDFAARIAGLLSARSAGTRIGSATQDGPLGGWAPVGPDAVELDFMLTQYVLEIQTAADYATSVEDSIYHDAEAMKLKRQIIDRFARSARTSTSQAHASIPCAHVWTGTGRQPASWWCACGTKVYRSYEDAVDD